MDDSTEGIWQTFAFASCHPKQVSCYDGPSREWAELAGKHHTPNEQHGRHLFPGLETFLTHRNSLTRNNLRN